MRRKGWEKVMDRLLILCAVAGLILFPVSSAVNGEELSPRLQPYFFSANPMFQADIMALEMRHRANSPTGMDYEQGTISAGRSIIMEATPEDRWNEIHLLGLTLSLSRHVQEKEYTRRRISMTPESPYNLDTMLPLLLRGARGAGDIEALSGFLSPHFNLKITF